MQAPDGPGHRGSAAGKADVKDQNVRPRVPHAAQATCRVDGLADDRKSRESGQRGADRIAQLNAIVADQHGARVPIVRLAGNTGMLTECAAGIVPLVVGPAHDPTDAVGRRSDKAQQTRLPTMMNLRILYVTTERRKQP